MVRLQKRRGDRFCEVEPHGLFVPGAQIRRCRKRRHGHGRGRQARLAVELDKLVAVGREHEPHVEALASGVAFGLVESVSRGQRVLLGLDQREGYRLCVGPELVAEHVVSPAARPASGFAANDLDAPRGFFAPDQVFGPTALIECGGDQFRARIGLVVLHVGAAPLPAVWTSL